MREFVRICFNAVCILTAVTLSVSAAPSAPECQIFISLNGSDSNSGRALNESVQSFAKALDLSLALPFQPTIAAAICFAPGSYALNATSYILPCMNESGMTNGSAPYPELIIRSTSGVASDVQLSGPPIPEAFELFLTSCVGITFQSVSIVGGAFGFDVTGAAIQLDDLIVTDLSQSGQRIALFLFANTPTTVSGGAAGSMSVTIRNSLVTAITDFSIEIWAERGNVTLQNVTFSDLTRTVQLTGFPVYIWSSSRDARESVTLQDVVSRDNSVTNQPSSSSSSSAGVVMIKTSCAAVAVFDSEFSGNRITGGTTQPLWIWVDRGSCTAGLVPPGRKPYRPAVSIERSSFVSNAGTGALSIESGGSGANSNILVNRNTFRGNQINAVTAPLTDSGNPLPAAFLMPRASMYAKRGLLVMTDNTFTCNTELTAGGVTRNTPPVTVDTPASERRILTFAAVTTGNTVTACDANSPIVCSSKQPATPANFAVCNIFSCQTCPGGYLPISTNGSSAVNTDCALITGATCTECPIGKYIDQTASFCITWYVCLFLTSQHYECCLTVCAVILYTVRWVHSLISPRVAPVKRAVTQTLITRHEPVRPYVPIVITVRSSPVRPMD